MKKFIFALVAALSVTLSVFAAAENSGESAIEVKDPENTLVMQLKDGDVIIEMYPDAAPKHVARIKELVRQGFYNGLKFHITAAALFLWPEALLRIRQTANFLFVFPTKAILTANIPCGDRLFPEWNMLTISKKATLLLTVLWKILIK